MFPARSGFSVPVASRQSFPVIFLIVSLVLGSLINSFPDETALINITDVTSNCSGAAIAAAISLESDALPPAPFSMSTTLALVFALLFPVIFNFLKQSQFESITSGKTLLPIYNHVSGQVLSFSSCEFLRHFLQFPQADNFVKACNLTEETCNMHEKIYTPLNLLCSNSSLDQTTIFDTLHTLPNISFVLLGASTVSLIINYLKPKASAAPLNPYQTAEQCGHHYFPIVKKEVIAEAATAEDTAEDQDETRPKNLKEEGDIHSFERGKIKLCNLQYFKFVLLVIYVLAIWYYIWQSLYFHKLPEMALSYSQGVLIQICVHYASSKKDLNFLFPLQPPSLSPSSPPLPAVNNQQQVNI